MGNTVKLKSDVDVNANTEGKQPMQLSYEKLKEICNGLANENHALREQLMQRGHAEAIKRIDFLFNVLQHAQYFDDEFIQFVVDDIKAVLTPIEKESSKQEEPDK